MKRVTGFGELLLRLAAPARERLLQSPRLDVVYGGAEANVLVSLARFGHVARMVSVLPDNALGAAPIGELRRWGVDTGGIRFGDGRMGLYFLEPGAIHRPSSIIYDRADSAFAKAAPDLIDWSAELGGIDWLHLSGITPALGPSAAKAALHAARAASAAGIGVSIDCNYRAKLWQAWGGKPAEVLRELLAHADLMFGDQRDVALILGGEVRELRAAADAAFEAFPRLRNIACTQREEVSADHHILSATLLTRDQTHEAGPRDVPGIVDRIGAGDAFAAGILHALFEEMPGDRAIAWALAATCLKHAQLGDASLATVDEVEALLSGQGLHVRR